MRLILLMMAFLCSNLTLLHANPDGPEKKLIHRIAAYYIRSIPSYDSRPTKIVTPKKRKLWQAEPIKISEQEKAFVIFHQIFANSPAIDSLQADMEPILNDYVWHDLKVFQGTESAPNYHLLARIDRTTTSLGRAALALMLATPTSDIQELQARQQVLQTLLQDKSTFEQLVSIYQQYAPIETNMLSFWSDYDPLYNDFYASFMEEVLYFNGKKTRRYNKLSKALELRKRCYFDLALALHGASLGFQTYYFYKVLTDQQTFKKITAKHNPLWIRILAWYPVATIPIELLSVKKHYDSWATPLRYLAARLADIQGWIMTAREIEHKIAVNPDLEKVYGRYLVNLRKLFNEPKDTELGKLINQLSTLSLKNWSVFFNHNGKLLQTYQLLLAHKDELTDAFYDFGKLDAFLSTVKLMQEVQLGSGEPAYSLTQFIKPIGMATPYLQLDEMWNPFLEAQKAVPNNLVMDANKGLSNMVLTGPNAGGKSVFLSGATISLLLSQTLGIVPARLAVITPFHKISTYLDVSEDIAQGYSLFMAEVKRAQGYLSILESLEKDKLSFCVMDEIFSGTNPAEGEAAAYSFVHHLSKYTHSLHIVATHFAKLTLLPQRAPKGHFANYQVEVNRNDPESKLQFTYQIKPGKSQQTIAIDILKEQGCNPEILKEAKEILNHPERYRSDFK